MRQFKFISMHDALDSSIFHITYIYLFQPEKENGAKSRSKFSSVPKAKFKSAHKWKACSHTEGYQKYNKVVFLFVFLFVYLVSTSQRQLILPYEQNRTYTLPVVGIGPSWLSIEHGHSRITTHLETATFNVCETLNLWVLCLANI